MAGGKTRRRRNRGGGSLGGSTAAGFPNSSVSRGAEIYRIPFRREYIGEVSGSNSAALVTSTYSIQPGNATTFPWLNQIAQRYEKYRFTQLDFVYLPEVSQYATEGQTGKVLLAVDFDASDAPPSTKQQMENTDVVETRIGWQEMRLRVPVQRMNEGMSWRYVRPGVLPGGSDIKTYDCGNLTVGSYNNGGTGVLGEVWVEYGLEFSTAVTESTTTAPANNSVAQFLDASANTVGTTGVTTFAALAGTTALRAFNPLNVVNTSGVLTPPAGNYLLDLDVNFVQAGTPSTTNINIFKNSTVIAGFALGAIQNLPYHICGFAQCNGTDTISVGVNCGFTGSDPTFFVEALRLTLI
jgi:hypothetical protein